MSEYAAVISGYDAQEVENEQLQALRSRGIPLNERDLLRTMNEIGPGTFYADVNSDWNFVLRARIATDHGYAKCSGMGWGNEEYYTLTNKGRALLGLEPIPSVLDRVKSFFRVRPQ